MISGELETKLGYFTHLKPIILSSRLSFISRNRVSHKHPFYLQGSNCIRAELPDQFQF